MGIAFGLDHLIFDPIMTLIFGRSGFYQSRGYYYNGELGELARLADWYWWWRNNHPEKYQLKVTDPSWSTGCRFGLASYCSSNLMNGCCLETSAIDPSCVLSDCFANYQQDCWTPPPHIRYRPGNTEAWVFKVWPWSFPQSHSAYPWISGTACLASSLFGSWGGWSPIHMIPGNDWVGQCVAK